MSTTSFLFGFGCGVVLSWGVVWLLALRMHLADKREERLDPSIVAQFIDGATRNGPLPAKAVASIERSVKAKSRPSMLTASEREERRARISQEYADRKTIPFDEFLARRGRKVLIDECRGMHPPEWTGGVWRCARCGESLSKQPPNGSWIGGAK